MKGPKNIKNVIIIILCITIISMGIGFIVLSVRLDGYRKEEEVFDVCFTNIKMLSSIKGGSKEPTGQLEIDSSGKILNMDFRLFKEHDEVDYEVTIKNKGTVEASIIKLFSSPDFRNKNVINEIAPVTISISDISGKLLEPGEETTIKISAIYNPSLNLGEETILEEVIDLSGKIGIIAASKN